MAAKPTSPVPSDRNQPRSLVRNSFKAVVGGSNATPKGDGAADRATPVTAPGERLQSTVNKVQQRVKT